jgi:hypothetical protein
MSNLGESPFGLLAGVGVLMAGWGLSGGIPADVTRTTNIDVPANSVVIPNDVFNQCASTQNIENGDTTVQITKNNDGSYSMTCPLKP